MAERYAKQIQQEERLYALGVQTIHVDDWDRIRKQIQRRGGVYKAFPSFGDQLILVSSLEGEELPQDRVQWIEDLIMEVPSGRRVSGSRGFGGTWSDQRSNADEGRYVILELSLDGMRSIVKEWSEEQRFKAELAEASMECPGPDGSYDLSMIDNPLSLLRKAEKREKQKPN